MNDSSSKFAADHSPRLLLFRLGASICLFTLWASVPPALFATKVNKLVTECNRNNSQACDRLRAIAINSKEKPRNRIAAMDTLNDLHILSQIAGSNDNAEVLAAAKSRLHVVVNSAFLHAVQAGDVAAMKSLAAKGAEVDPHGSAHGIENLTPIPGGYQYRLVCNAETLASEPMLVAIQSGRLNSVQALIDLGSRIDGDYVTQQAQISTGSGFIQPEIAWNAACYGLSVAVLPTFALGANGVARSITKPIPERKETYVDYARQFGHDDIVEVLVSHGATKRTVINAQKAVSASQETSPTNASSGRSSIAASAKVKYITQSNNYPDGTHHETKLVEEKMEWNREFHGFVITARAKKKDPGLVELKPPDEYKVLLHESTNSVLPTKIVKSVDQLPVIDFHTDITAIRAFKMEDPSALEFYGKVSMCLIPAFNTPDHKSKLFYLAGTPGTRVDLSPLFPLKEQVEFLGRYWRPTKDKEAILVVTTNAIYALNLEVSEIKTNAP